MDDALKQQLANQLQIFLSYQNMANDHINGWRETGPHQWVDLPGTQLRQCSLCGDTSRSCKRQLWEMFDHCFCAKPVIKKNLDGSKSIAYTRDQYREYKIHLAYNHIKTGLTILKHLGEI